VVEVLKQAQYRPMPVEQQITIIYAVTNGHLDDVPVGKIREWEASFLEFLAASHPQVGKGIRTKRTLDDELTTALKAAIEGFKAIA
jgi:F-type H+-transporting ATPase subunit alpha